MGRREGGSAERPATFFDGPEDFRDWLEQHHETAEELWMGLHGKHVPDRGLTWAEAVPEALCFGWIDSVSQRIDDDARRQRWTPRRRTSIWSAVNVAHVERLTAQGRMHPAGIAAYEARTPERTGVYSFEQPDLALSAEQEAALRVDPGVWAFWEAATAGYRKGVIAWLIGAKREATRAQRLATLVDDCSAGRLIPPQRYGDTPSWVARATAARDAARGAAEEAPRVAGGDDR
ncbi:YdeI/OmpD-associated family protein [Serinicoccus sp. LYQ131]|uniref:YdeI/OmpD-associated family protein n=1 Tax=Serinicoccus sp. LYQ131 TaxID=3378797 RepID=UPI003854F7AE